MAKLENIGLAFEALNYQNLTIERNLLDSLESVDIGAWRPYNILIREEQLRLQEQNLLDTGLYNGDSSIKFIYTDYMADAMSYLEDISTKLRIEDTVVSLEDEVYYTSKIEGAKTTRVRTTQIHNGEYLDFKNYKSEKMVQNGFAAVKALNLYGGKLNEKILLDVWRVLVDGVCENEDIRGDKYRVGDVTVGNYTPPASDKVDLLVNGLINFYNSTTLDQYPFLKASLIHYAFETIHPFCDGNGRMGRLLVNNYLLKQGIESAKAVSFSMCIDARRNHYEVAFVDSENNHNDCTPFLSFMLEVMVEAYSNAYRLKNL